MIQFRSPDSHIWTSAKPFHYQNINVGNTEFRLKEIELKYLSSKSSTNESLPIEENNFDNNLTKVGHGSSQPHISESQPCNQIPLLSGYGYDVGHRNTIEEQISHEILPKTVVRDSSVESQKDTISEQQILSTQWKRHQVYSKKLISKLKSKGVTFDNSGSIYLNQKLVLALKVVLGE